MARTLVQPTHPGRTDGTAVPAGNIGQILTGVPSSGTTMSNQVIYPTTGLTITPGGWKIYFKAAMAWSTAPTINQTSVSISTSNSSHDVASLSQDGGSYSNGSRPTGWTFAFVNISVNTTYYGLFNADFSGGTNVTTYAGASQFFAERIG